MGVEVVVTDRSGKCGFYRQLNNSFFYLKKPVTQYMEHKLFDKVRVGSFITV